MKPSLLWLRLDLRLADNPALHAAIRHGGAVIPVFIHSPEEEQPWPPGGASNWWRHQSLAGLGKKPARVRLTLGAPARSSAGKFAAARAGNRRDRRLLEPPL